MHRTIVTAGHVDHGKSRLVRALTGMEPDRLDDERRRGLTIDLGYAWTTLPDGQTVAFVDAPGHERLIRTMLAGAATAPGALFVVAADDGWSAQSSEHRDLLDLLEVPVLAVVMTKIDRVGTADRAAAAAGIVAAAAGTALAQAPLVAVDSVTGEGINELRRVLATRLGALSTPPDAGRPRLWIDRAFAPRGTGTVATGTLDGGTLAADERLVLLPGRREVRVRGLQTLGMPAGQGRPGMRVAVRLAGVAHTELTRGDALVGSGPWQSTARLDVALRVLPGCRVERRGAWRLHAGTAAAVARVQPLTGPVDGPGDVVVRVHLDRPLPLVTGDRVVLREVGRARTVAGGRVADPRPAARPRGGAARQRRADDLLALSRTDPDRARLAGLLAVRPGNWAERSEALAATGLTEELALPDLATPSDSTPAGGTTADRGPGRLGDLLVAPPTWAAWLQGLAALGPGSHGRDQVAAALAAAGCPSAAGVVDALVRGGRLVRVGGALALAGTASQAGRAVDERSTRLVTALAAEPFAPPALDDLADQHGVDHRLLTALVNAGEIVRCGPVAFAAAAVPEALRRLAVLESRVGPFTAAQARTAWETTRRFAIPLLEHLDATGCTTFDGQRRRLTDRGRARAAATTTGAAPTEGGQSPVGPS